MTDQITALDFYYEKILLTHRFDYCRKCFDVIKFFFLFITMSYLLFFVLQDMPKPILFQFEIPFFCNNLSFIWASNKFLDTVFNQWVINLFHNVFLFWPVISYYSFVKRCWLICSLIISIRAKHSKDWDHISMRFGCMQANIISFAA